MAWTILQIIIIFLFPTLAKRISQKTVAWLSPVLLCYSLGILLANLNLFPVNESVATYFTQGTILLAIPFLLFATDLKSWTTQFKTMTVAFLACVFSGIVGTVLTGFLFKDSIDNYWLLSGMIAAIFSGGIPNMQAVGMALSADSEIVVLLNASDIFIGGFYLIFLTSLASKFLNIFLKKYSTGKYQMSKNNFNNNKRISKQNLLKALGLSLGIISISVGLSFLFYQSLAATFIILCLTTLSILASQIETVRKWEGTFEVGDYLLLMFCVAVGMLANFDNALLNGQSILLFMAVAWFITVVSHWLLCFLLKIDVDTTMVSSTAAIYGPVFVGQIVSTIKNRQLIFPGIAMGLLGIAMGNYVGIFVAWLLR
ncbi:MAG: DUF819 family protein [Bacteroidota bacterium]